ncbi:Transthyretin-like family protein [Caenorhabditis elegans]|uniref:Transthyretin-like family protein n=1 Tax=Caenorhabditis elegans TaxID=6239 RepID=O01517_CAEEL|nr:Transthyretin-like family protein [Caenorhabditis elegans]CCD67755.1 Transthyretin-like family protein [Caenorhabditis elegans]|eukprot:NP_504946.2 TransThyretin-Related family domain [Caenorhabditis elegans]
MWKLILLISLGFPIVNSIGEGSFHVSGRLMCGGKPYANESVSIYEKNYMLTDILMESLFTDEDGNFSVKTFGKDWPHFTPYLYAPNYCKPVDNFVFADRECTDSALQILIPTEFVSPTRTPTKIFDIGEIDMSADEVKYENVGLGSVGGGFLVNDKRCKYRNSTST